MCKRSGVPVFFFSSIVRFDCYGHTHYSSTTDSSIVFRCACAVQLTVLQFRFDLKPLLTHLQKNDHTQIPTYFVAPERGCSLTGVRETRQAARAASRGRCYTLAIRFLAISFHSGLPWAADAVKSLITFIIFLVLKSHTELTKPCWDPRT